MKGRRTHHHRLHPQGSKSGEAIEREAISHAQSGKAAEGDAVRHGGGRVRRRRGGAVPGRKPARRIDKQARGDLPRAPTTPSMPWSGAETRKAPPVASSQRAARGGGIHIKPSHKGLLHKDLGVASGKPIPAKKLAAAKNSSDPAVRRRATFAQNAKSWGR